MKNIFVFFLCLFSFLNMEIDAQNYIEQSNALVISGSDTLINPFCGGLNSTQLEKADLNNDGKEDLVIWDNNTRTLKTFININNTSGQIAYQYEPKFTKNFPPIYSYLKLVDYNCDGIKDLFHRGQAGVNVSRGFYQNGELHFQLYKELYHPGAFGVVNCYVQNNDIPAILDVDNDGDIDILSFDVVGVYVNFYENKRSDEGLNCDTMKMELNPTCWGKFYQNTFLTHALNVSCKAGGIQNQNKQRHVGNCILIMDYDGDIDKDIFIGSIGNKHGQLLKNGGTLANPIMTSQDTTFQSTGHILELQSWPSAFYFDLDNDNKKELLFTPHSDDLFSEDYNNIYMYKNIGSVSIPIWQYQSNTYLFDDMIDRGSFSYPSLFDFDKDGKLDLFIGGEGKYNPITNMREYSIAYYHNISSVNQIGFEKITDDFLNLSTKNIKGMYPTFGDINSDGIEDLLIGNDSGTIVLYKNIAASNLVPANFIFETDSMPGVFTTNYSFPFVYDMNSDNKKDILIGDRNGNISLYIDSGSSFSANFKLFSSQLGNIKTGSNFSFYSYAVPFVGKADSTNNVYIFVGNADGNIERYSQFSNLSSPFFRADSFFSDIHTAPRSAIQFGDLDNNGTIDLIVGNQNGGLQLYKNVSSIGTKDWQTENVLSFEIYPNPTNQFLNIKSAYQDLKDIESIRIYNLQGKIVYENTGQKTTQINIELLSPGLYFVQIQTKNKMGNAKFIKL